MKAVRQNLEERGRPLALTSTAGSMSPRPYSSSGPLSITFPSAAASAMGISMQQQASLVPRPPQSPVPASKSITDRNSNGLTSSSSTPSPAPPSYPNTTPLTSVRALTHYSSAPSPSPSTAIGGLTLVLRDDQQRTPRGGIVPPLSTELIRFSESKELVPASNGSQSARASTAGRARSFRAGKSLPPVLDSFARTQAAVFSDERFYHSASAKIASFLTPEAANWHIDLPTGRYKETKCMWIPPAACVLLHMAELSASLLLFSCAL
jgi:hypothetical protein